MSHSVTITRTTTTTTAIICNTGYMKTVPGLLKLGELVLNIVCVGILSYFYTNYTSYYYSVEELYFLLVSVTLLIGTFIILLSCLLSIGTASILPKTIYEYLYHGFAFLLYLSAGITLLVLTSDKYQRHYSEKRQNATIAAAVMGLVNAGLYLISAILAYRSYTHG